MFVIKRFFFIINFLVAIFLLGWLIREIKELLLPISVVLFIFTIFISWFICYKLTPIRKSLSLFAVPLLLLIGVLLSLLVVEVSWIRYVLIALFALLSSYYYNVLFLYLNNSKWYQSGSMSNLSFYISIITFFLVSVSFYSFFLLLNVPLYYLSLVLFLFFTISGLSIFRIGGVDLNRNLYLIFVGSIISVEIFVSLSYWPVSYYISGFILTLFFYCFYGILRLKLKGYFSKKILRNYIFLIILGLILALSSARWL